MKKKVFAVVGIVIVIAVALACFYPRDKKQVNTTPLKQLGQATATVSKDQVIIQLKGIGSGGKAKVYAYGANQYCNDDHVRGISKEVKSTGTLVGDYNCGKSEILTVKRYHANGYDGLYNKYYVIQKNKLLYGPFYATNIASEKQNIALKQKSIKGLFNENSTNLNYAKDLGANSVTMNLDLGTLLYANTHPADAYSMKVNGKTYYFNKANVDSIDSVVKASSQAGMNVIAVCNAWKNNDMNLFSKSLRYNSPKSTILMGTNTSNDTGRDQYIAMMEFLAHRYSQSAGTGLISTYVMSNEIDFTHYFYDCDNLNTFMEEYSRALRLANLAIKKYAADVNVAVPFTHYWAKSAGEMFKECPGASLAPKDMVDWLAKYTNARGAYDWAIAPHCYGTVNTKSNLAASDVNYKALTGNYKTSPQITFSNFELWNQYLSQPDLLYKGKQRSVYLTESGASSSKGTTQGLNEQAATLAQVYYKVAQMPFVKSFNYYRLNDHPEEAKNGLACGLLDTNNKKKPAYTVYKYIDTKDSTKYTNPYLKYINFNKDGKTEMSVAKGTVKSWKDTMTVYTSKFNWNKQWDLNKVYLSK